MKRALLLLFVALPVLSCSQGYGDVSPQFAREIQESGLVSKPLPLHDELSFEQLTFSGAKVKATLPIEGILTITFPLDPGFRAKGSPSDPDYATYGDHRAAISLDGADLERYNYLVFNVSVDSPGDLAPSVNLVFVNREDTPKDGFTPPAGAHLVPLSQGLSRCGFWIGDLRRDCVDRVEFYVTNRGWNLEPGAVAGYVISDLAFEDIDAAVKVSGWEPLPNQIIHSNSGYYTGGAKTAVMAADGAPDIFSLCTENGREVFSAPVVLDSSDLGDFAVLDFSAFVPKKDGNYYLKAGESASGTFRIAAHPFDELQWKAVNFIFGQRCGHEVEGVHPLCHSDLFAVHDGDTLCYGGGWHDAGDLSQQTLQTGDVAFGLLEAAAAAAKRAPTLSKRLEGEALWGLEFLEKVRFPDGFRASSMGLLLWQDGIIPSRDDIYSVRIQGMAYDNYLYAAYEAFAAGYFKGELSDSFRERAERDFSYAEKKFAADGYDIFVQPYEHTYSTSRSQHMAAVSWASSLLYKCTGREKYAARARKAMDYVLACQLAEGPGQGGFCRDTTLGSMVHSVHQSREQLFAQALESILETQPENESRQTWTAALASYASYLKRLMAYAGPYGMMPSGIYSVTEPEDAAAFLQQNVFLPEDAAPRFLAQLRSGVQLDREHYLRRFPVWFGIYNGGNAILLSQGKAAAIAAGMLGDAALYDAARAQLYWLLGMNPFGQSMAYGEGRSYPLMDSFSSGTFTGEMPVGIRTIGDSDVPYWPQVNNACYKEVWTTVAGKLLSLLAEL
ncbi:MAG: glycoside hydrolase family 9 protein [Bacteroidales bacterium]|nr:glycoside hydrolase family 9 protein [Bacteroidales bacterium]